MAPSSVLHLCVSRSFTVTALDLACAIFATSTFAFGVLAVLALVHGVDFPWVGLGVGSSSRASGPLPVRRRDGSAIRLVT